MNAKKWETHPLGKNWWVRLFRKQTEMRIDVLENQMRSIINSLGLIEPEEGEREFSMVDKIEELERKIKTLEERTYDNTIKN